ncbi:hypothetical protein QTN47_02070 [Danxiaibacter flavus]|uniref:Lipoprotein n=1 Tax=Danxiaibacter flavus TaxID=3049108 RepID=A0ABV3Z8R1_9BACT|nr:hypothetical protein QNM32_02070 [Chitinophagaceae bacterium DXS]
MKNILITAIATGAFLLGSCGNHNGKNNETDTTDKSITIPPPDNSSATNPSLGDTTTQKVRPDTVNPKDTVRRK